jgi:hypothetical protein
MEAGWYFYRFDYGRYLALRPALRSATTPAAFGALAVGQETEELATALLADEITLPEARNAFIQAVCCVGDPLNLDAGLSRFVTALGRRSGSEDAAELLGEMLTGGRNMEAWLLPASGLAGFLTPEETQALLLSYRARPSRGRLRRTTGQGKRRRRGGLVGVCVGFVSRLLDRGPQWDDMYHLLGNLIEEAARHGEGIAVVAA